MGDNVVRFSHSGTRYLLGFGGDFFGIWDRAAPDHPIERYPRTDEGWREAWLRFSAIEDHWVDIPASDSPRGNGLAGGGMPDLVADGVVVLASPIARLGARIVDGLIVAAVLTALVASNVVHVDETTLQQTARQLIGVTLLVGFLYETTLIALRGQTLGKVATRIRVVRMDDGAVPGWGPAFVRWLIPVAASIVPFGALPVYLWLLWDLRRQGLHDKAARTLVVVAHGG